jgi:hypothetical protein
LSAIVNSRFSVSGRLSFQGIGLPIEHCRHFYRS